MAPIREKPYRENGEYADFCFRIMRAMARRAGGDVDLLPRRPPSRRS